ncbi:MAG TPA: DNA polymerase/3'-5' exonuclease PolX [Gemmatimonadales bacterium]|jgi:DNA polymerase (family 10)|nr:DNA polymerase/3'-5' exonuclease PolX [Gemmatimonadales bacterium]
MQNADIARLLDEVADLLEISEANPFKVRAYHNAARTVRDHPEPLADLVRAGGFDLTDLPSIGEGIAEEIEALVATGELPQRRALVRKLPPGLLDLLRIAGLGPKRVKLLHDKLKVKTVADLAKAVEQGKVAELRGFGPTMVEKIRAGLGQARRTESRLLLHEAEQHAHALVEYMRTGGGIDQIEVAGSFRRRRETIGDLDVLVTGPAPDQLIGRFTRYPDVKRVASQGPTRATVRLASGLQVDLRAVEPDAYGSALMYFTGSKAHNVELRTIAQAKKLKLNEYGLYQGTRRIAGRTEQEIYAKLGLDWIPPELREARGEIELARTHRLPALVTLEQIRGDLQMHSDASDGKTPIGPLIDAARALGYAYIAITDHSKRVSMSGLDAAQLRAQWKAIDKVNADGDGVRVLKSVELDVLENGRLDLPDDVLAEADYVVATIHYGLKQSERQITERLLGAIANPWVDAIGHPTGRVVNARGPYPLDFDAVARAAAGAGCLLEINGSERMDLPDTLAAAAKAQGVRFVLSTDAHHPGQLGNMRFAVAVARRAGLEADDVANTRSLPDFLQGLRRAKRR